MHMQPSLPPAPTEEQRAADRRTNQQILMALVISGALVALGLVALFTGVAQAASDLLDQMTAWLDQLDK
jgi:uncharacterized membrane protein